MRTNRGFTIIEVAVVIAIVGVIAVISIPNMTVMLRRMRLNSATVHVERSVGIAKKMSIANRMRHCISFTADTLYGNGNDDAYLITTLVQQETGVDTGVWVTVTEPQEFAGWTNDATTQLYRGVSLESDPTTTTAFSTTDGCAGLLFNSSGYLANPTADFAFACGGENCAKLTLRSKAQRYVEQRTLWIDQGGNVRTSVGPTTIPSL